VCSTLQKFWATYNFTDYHDGWDHQSDRLGTIIGVADDGRSCEVLRAQLERALATLYGDTVSTLYARHRLSRLPDLTFLSPCPPPSVR
jgi:hypothetical protein